MREILFRGKRIDNGEWVDGFYKQSTGNNKSMIASGADFYWHEVDPATVGQFTGLTDKNGKKIFEGDFLKFEIFGKEYLGLVEFIDDFGMFMITGCGRSDSELWLCSIKEVVGNVFDTSDPRNE